MAALEYLDLDRRATGLLESGMDVWIMQFPTVATRVSRTNIKLGNRDIEPLFLILKLKNGSSFHPKSLILYSGSSRKLHLPDQENPENHAMKAATCPYSQRSRNCKYAFGTNSGVDSIIRNHSAFTGATRINQSISESMRLSVANNVKRNAGR